MKKKDADYTKQLERNIRRANKMIDDMIHDEDKFGIFVESDKVIKELEALRKVLLGVGAK